MPQIKTKETSILSTKCFFRILVTTVKSSVVQVFLTVPPDSTQYVSIGLPAVIKTAIQVICTAPQMIPDRK